MQVMRGKAARIAAVVALTATFAVAAVLPAAPAQAAGWCFYTSTDLDFRANVSRSFISGNDGCISELRVAQAVDGAGSAAATLAQLGLRNP